MEPRDLRGLIQMLQGYGVKSFSDGDMAIEFFQEEPQKEPFVETKDNYVMSEEELEILAKNEEEKNKYRSS